jgi:hypothetical protein
MAVPRTSGWSLEEPQAADMALCFWSLMGKFPQELAPGDDAMSVCEGWVLKPTLFLKANYLTRESSDKRSTS